MSQTIILSSVGYVFFILIHGYFLKKNGQTIGKKVVGTKIVKLDGSLPSFWSIVIRRYMLIGIVSLIPVLGSKINLIGILLIFGKRKRCLHDYIAGTVVVDNERIPVDKIEKKKLRPLTIALIIIATLSVILFLILRYPRPRALQPQHAYPDGKERADDINNWDRKITRD